MVHHYIHVGLSAKIAIVDLAVVGGKAIDPEGEQLLDFLRPWFVHGRLAILCTRTIH